MTRLRNQRLFFKLSSCCKYCQLLVFLSIPLISLHDLVSYFRNDVIKDVIVHLMNFLIYFVILHITDRLIEK